MNSSKRFSKLNNPISNSFLHKCVIGMVVNKAVFQAVDTGSIPGQCKQLYLIKGAAVKSKSCDVVCLFVCLFVCFFMLRLLARLICPYAVNN